MKALTLRHPWAWAIVHCGKDVENRTWKPVGLEKGDFLALHGAVAPTAKLARTGLFDAEGGRLFVVLPRQATTAGPSLRVYRIAPR